MSKKLSSSIIFTTVVDEHNHPMTPSPTTTIAKYRKFNNEMIQFIEFCVKSRISGAQPIDSDPGMASAKHSEFSSSAHCLCLFHIDLNLKKNL
ncbi:12767_t:CDS:2 [Gigaspora rosea]|nr:12767_t:CDS:2 [Gigaspora rosea]